MIMLGPVDWIMVMSICNTLARHWIIRWSAYTPSCDISTAYSASGLPSSQNFCSSSCSVYRIQSRKCNYWNDGDFILEKCKLQKWDKRRQAIDVQYLRQCHDVIGCLLSELCMSEVWQSDVSQLFAHWPKQAIAVFWYLKIEYCNIIFIPCSIVHYIHGDETSFE